jgi:hypothetical protein
LLEKVSESSDFLLTKAAAAFDRISRTGETGDDDTEDDEGDEYDEGEETSASISGRGTGFAFAIFAATVGRLA